MDFSKYVSFLESSALFFPRADLLGDPYEGATSHINKQLWPIVYKGVMPESTLKSMSDFSQWARQWTYVSCWHMNEFESAAMWRLYAKTTDAVAIQTTYAKLHELLPSGSYVGTVQYMDYKTTWMPEDNAFHRFVRKRNSFEHERELRAIIQPIPVEPNGFDFSKQNAEVGPHVPVDIPGLVQGIYVAPTSPAWFRELVERITQKYGLQVPVKQSALDVSPIF